MDTINVKDMYTVEWTDEQINNLNEYQECNWVHPFTCPNRGDGKHIRNKRDLSVLTATKTGWICLCCGYTQNWAHDFMFKGAPQNPLFLWKK
jgi:hypothetical protein